MLWLVLAFLPCFAQAQTPFIPVVQIGVASSGNTCVFSNPVASGNVLIGSSSWESSTSTPSVTDTRTSSYSVPTLAAKTLSTAGNVKAAVSVATAASNGANTITFSVSGATFQWTSCAEFPSNTWTTTIDAADSQIATGTPASITSATLTTARNSDLIYAHVGGFNSGGAFVIGGGYTTAGIQQGHDSAAQEFKIAGTNGGYTASFNTTGNTDVTLVTIALRSAPITFQSPALLPDGALSKAYNYTLLATGGTGAYAMLNHFRYVANRTLSQQFDMCHHWNSKLKLQQ